MKKIKLLILVFGLMAVYAAGCSSSKSAIDTDDPNKAFDIAKRNFDKGEYLDAIDDFSLIKVKFPGSAVSDKVQFYLAESYFMKKEYLLAAYEYETFQKNYPLSSYIPDSKYRLGLCYYFTSPKSALDQEFTHYAISELSQFIDQYPENKNVADAESKLRDLKNKLAYKDFYIGENYMKVDNFRAAAIYFQNVYENFIETEWADDAMLGHVDAYINARKYEDARLLLEKFYKLFPKSDLKPKADKLRRSIPG